MAVPVVAMPAFNREALPSLAPPLIERPPRSYFTGREADLAKLATWLSTPGRAQITSVHGQGGIGKTELARVVDHLESPDLGEGAAAADRELVLSTLTRSFRDLSEEDRKVFLALGVLPAPGALGEMVADVLQEPAPRVAREKAEALARNGHPWRQANVLQARGDLEGGRSNWPQAFDWYKQAVPLYESVGSSVGLSNVLAEIAHLLEITGERDQAAETAAAALEIAQRCENRYALNLAGRVLEWAREPAEPEMEE